MMKRLGASNACKLNFVLFATLPRPNRTATVAKKLAPSPPEAAIEARG